MSTSPRAQGTNFYGFQAEDIDGKKVDLGKYRGKVAVVVNTASRCGFTPQYKDLETLYKKYKSQGVAVLGFPSNDFGGQEPGSNKEIKTFCMVNYKTSFPLFSKVKVTPGKGQSEIYAYLTEQKDPLGGDVEWNFEKFIIDKEGNVAFRFKSNVNPIEPKVTQAIDSLLEKKD